jgi:hypothetical protein
MEQTPIKSTPRDVFIYILGTIALYLSAFSAILLLLFYVDIALPDPLRGDYFDPRGEIRWSLAMLVVIFPVYLWTVRFIRRDVAREPAKADIRVRKWLLNLTLFLAALLIIGDLVHLIFNFLEGDLTTQFILKVVAVLVVAAAIFWYYLMDLRTKAAPFAPKARGIVYAVLAGIAVVVLAGFFMAGSPFRQRLARFDMQKVNDLQNIQSQVVTYWQHKDALPKSLAELRDDIAGYAAPEDPQSGEAYEYRTTGELAFELCAAFNLPSEERGRGTAKPYYSPDGIYPAENWDHDEGRTCFSRTIDPDLYQTEKPIPVR